jgi:MFS family permease
MKKYRDHKIAVLAMVFLEGFSWTLSIQIIPPLLPLIMKEFSLSYLEAGLINTSTMIIYCLLQYPIGLLADRFGRKNVIVFGLFWSSAISFLIPLVQSYSELLILLAVGGIGNGMHFIPSAALISEYFEPQVRGRALSISGSAMSISMFIAPFIAIPIANVYGWKVVFRICSGIILVVALIFWIIVREPKSNKSNQIRKSDRSFIFRSSIVKLALIAHILGYITPVASFIPTFLTEKFAMNLNEAGIFYAMIPLANILMSLTTISGQIVDRLKGRIGLFFPSILMIIATLSLVFPINSSILFPVMILNGISTSILMPAILSYASKITRPTHRATEMGFINTLWVLSGVISPSIIGAVIDISSFDIAFVTVTIISSLSLIFESTMPESINQSKH